MGPEQAVGLFDSLAAYTVGAAASSCLEDSLGTIAPGMLADLALFEEDVTSAEPSASEICAGDDCSWREGVMTR